MNTNMNPMISKFNMVSTNNSANLMNHNPNLSVNSNTLNPNPNTINANNPNNPNNLSLPLPLSGPVPVPVPALHNTSSTPSTATNNANNYAHVLAVQPFSETINQIENINNKHENTNYTISCEPAVEDCLILICDEFVNELTELACKLAKLRGNKPFIEIKDIQTAAEVVFHMSVHGMGETTLSSLNNLNTNGVQPSNNNNNNNNLNNSVSSNNLVPHNQWSPSSIAGLNFLRLNPSENHRRRLIHINKAEIKQRSNENNKNLNSSSSSSHNQNHSLNHNPSHSHSNANSSFSASVSSSGFAEKDRDKENSLIVTGAGPQAGGFVQAQGGQKESKKRKAANES